MMGMSNEMGPLSTISPALLKCIEFDFYRICMPAFIFYAELSEMGMVFCLYVALPVVFKMKMETFFLVFRF